MKQIEIITLSLLLLSCRSVTDAPTPLPDVITSIYPLYDMILNLSGDEILADYIVPVGANPHSYEPTPADAKRIQAARYFIGVHPEFDGWMKSLIHEKTEVLYLSGEACESHHEADHTHSEENPHIWLNPNQMKRICGQISEFLMFHYPEHRDPIRKRSLHYIEKLDSLDQAIRQLFSGIENPRFAQWHPAWDGFASDYGLEIAGTISHGHGDRPGVKAFRRLVETCKAKHVRVVVVGLNVKDNLAETLAHEIDGRLLVLDTLGSPEDPKRDTYLELMGWNAERLAEALKGSF